MPHYNLSSFASLFEPKVIVVIGASASSGGGANNFLRCLKASEYEGRVYPIHRTAKTIEGFSTCQSLVDVPEQVDYAYIAVSATQTTSIFDGTNGKVKFAQVISSGFSEVAGGAELQKNLVESCHRAGIRLLGPNCLGLHSPRGRITFVDRALMTPGSVGVLSQSGGLSIDIIRRGQYRGLRFSGLVSVGNCADIGVNDLLEFFLIDEATKVIGLYLEDISDGRRLFEILRKARARKPIVILKGGRTQAGQRASASHTGSLAHSDHVWVALAKQTGSCLVDTIDQFIDSLLIFQSIKVQSTRPSRKVAMFGNGGGVGVLASDAFSHAGFFIPELSITTTNRLKALELPAGSSIGNPIDTPGGALRKGDGIIGCQILGILFDDIDIDIIVLYLNMPAILTFKNPHILPNIIRAALNLKNERITSSHFVIVLRSDGEAELEVEKQKYRFLATELGVPVFDEVHSAANALSTVVRYEEFLDSRRFFDP